MDLVMWMELFKIKDRPHGHRCAGVPDDQTSWGRRSSLTWSSWPSLGLLALGSGDRNRAAKKNQEQMIKFINC